MRWSILSLFKFPRGLIPSKQGLELLDQGYNVLKKGDYDKAKSIYKSLSSNDQQAKFAKGFYSAIENKKKSEEYLQKIKERHNFK